MQGVKDAGACGVDERMLLQRPSGGQPLAGGDEKSNWRPVKVKQ